MGIKMKTYKIYFKEFSNREFSFLNSESTLVCANSFEEALEKFYEEANVDGYHLVHTFISQLPY